MKQPAATKLSHNSMDAATLPAGVSLSQFPFSVTGFPILVPLFLSFSLGVADTKAPNSDQNPVPAVEAVEITEAGLPQSPSELYARLAEATRPQWRQLYRPTVTRCLEGRPQAAMGLGAVTADLFLAAQARDTQQIRNLIQDEETIEKTLGMIERMAPFRVEVLTAADQSDWPRVGEAIEKFSAGQRRSLRTQKDEPLAELAYIGQWLRTLQICHSVVISKELEDQQLAIGNPLLIAEMTRRLTKLSDPATEELSCLKLLHKRLAGLSRLWPADLAAVVDPVDRLRRSADLLSDTVGTLLQEEDSPGSGSSASPP